MTSDQAQYPTPTDARVAYPYIAVLASPTESRSLPSSWAYARQLDSGEVEVLYDGHGTTERLPGSHVRLRAPETPVEPQDPNSAHAWDQFLNNQET